MIQKLTALHTTLQSEMEKFQDGNKSAGTRARKILQDIKLETKVVRDAIQAKKTSADVATPVAPVAKAK